MISASCPRRVDTFAQLPSNRLPVTMSDIDVLRVQTFEFVKQIATNGAATAV